MINIRRITIKNFRQYKNVDLKFNNKTGLNLFIGKNGMGKSNFLNAICWCLYEKQPFKFHEDEKKLLNEEASVKNKYDEVKVELEVGMDDKIFLFKRTKRESQQSTSIVMIKQDEDWVAVENPRIIINNFLPESVSKFFLFDGEAVQNLYRGNYAINLKDGVWCVSDVLLLDNALEHVESTYSEVKKRISKDDPKTENLDKIVNDLISEKSEIETKKLKNEEAHKKLTEQLNQLENKFKNYDKYREQQKIKNQLKEDIKEVGERLKEYQKQINDLVIEYAPFWFLKEELIETGKRINSIGIKGELPPKIKSTFIEELIEKKRCICGTIINKDDKAYKNLLALKNEVSPFSDRIFLIEDKVSINSLIKDLSQKIPEDITKIRFNRAKDRKNLDSLQTRLKEIEQSLIKAPEEEVGNIQSTINKTKEEIEKLLKEIGEQSFRIEQLKAEIKEKEEELNRLNRKKEGLKAENEKSNFLEEARDKIEFIRSKIIEQVRQSVSLNTDKYFKELIWKKDEFEKVSFTENYEVEVIKSGEKVSSLKILSTGEMKVLSFATIKALALLSGFNDMPLFIDGPLENLDKEVEVNFLKLLPSFIKNKQVFIFSLDKNAIIEFGKKNVNKENFYLLARENQYRSTVIKQFH